MLNGENSELMAYLQQIKSISEDLEVFLIVIRFKKIEQRANGFHNWERMFPAIGSETDIGRKTKPWEGEEVQRQERQAGNIPELKC